jgi:hypothetical protein
LRSAGRLYAPVDENIHAPAAQRVLPVYQSPPLTIRCKNACSNS